MLTTRQRALRRLLKVNDYPFDDLLTPPLELQYLDGGVLRAMQHAEIAPGDFVDVTLSLRYGLMDNVFSQAFRLERVVKILSKEDVGVCHFLVADCFSSPSSRSLI